MNVLISNFRGIKRAEINLSKLALVAGANAAGKSSVAHAVAAALSGAVVPLAGLKKTEAGMLVHAGTGRGTISVDTEQGAIRVDYPQARIETTGQPPAASLFAVGLKSIVDMPGKEAAATLIEYLKATPARGDVLDATEKLGLDEKQQEQLWQKISDLGWDGAHAAAKEMGVKLKGQWEAATGERYGSSKGESWVPKGWETGLEAASEESLAADLTQAREFVEAAIAANAVTAADRDRWKATADGVDEARILLERSTIARDAFNAKAEALQNAWQTLPKPGAAEQCVPCPHCGADVVIRGGTLAAPVLTDAKEDRERNDAILKAEAAYTDAINKRNAEVTTMALLSKRIRDGQAAAKSLASTPESAPAADLEHAREVAQRAEVRAAAFRAHRTAARLHHGIGLNALVQAMLAPDGLRLARLRAALREFNTTIGALCSTAGWGMVEIGEDAAASYDGKPLVLLSASETFRVRATLQAAMASMDKSAALVVDAADVLDRAGRNCLMRMLGSVKLPSVVCMTMARADVPDMKDRGTSYWIEGGVTMPAREGAP